MLRKYFQVIRFRLDGGEIACCYQARVDVKPLAATASVTSDLNLIFGFSGRMVATV